MFRLVLTLIAILISQVTEASGLNTELDFTYSDDETKYELKTTVTPEMRDRLVQTVFSNRMVGSLSETVIKTGMDYTMAINLRMSELQKITDALKEEAELKIPTYSPSSVDFSFLKGRRYKSEKIITDENDRSSELVLKLTKVLEYFKSGDLQTAYDNFKELHAVVEILYDKPNEIKKVADILNLYEFIQKTYFIDGIILFKNKEINLSTPKSSNLGKIMRDVINECIVKEEKCSFDIIASSLMFIDVVDVQVFERIFQDYYNVIERKLDNQEFLSHMCNSMNQSDLFAEVKKMFSMLNEHELYQERDMYFKLLSEKKFKNPELYFESMKRLAIQCLM